MTTQLRSRTRSAGTEEWRPIPGYEGRYEVSDRGRVLSIPRDRRPHRILRPKVMPKSGYRRVTLWNEGARTDVSVHRLVLITFVGPPPEGEQCRHLNGYPGDNRRVNLAWGTPSENQHDTVRHGTHRNARRTHCKNNHAFAEHGVLVTIPSRSKPFRRCVTCHREARQAQPTYRPKPIQPGDGDPRHASQTGYRHGCRCDPCRLAHNRDKRESRARARAAA